MASEDQPKLNREIEALAYHYWEEDGCPENREVEHWERAERELRRRNRDSPMDGQSPGGIPNDTGASGKMG